MNRVLSIAFRTLLTRAAAQAEDCTVASVTVLERLCALVAEQTPALVSVATEYLWRRKRYASPIEARDFIIQRVLAHYEVQTQIVFASAV